MNGGKNINGKITDRIYLDYRSLNNLTLIYHKTVETLLLPLFSCES